MLLESYRCLDLVIVKHEVFWHNYELIIALRIATHNGDTPTLESIAWMLNAKNISI